MYTVPEEQRNKFPRIHKTRHGGGWFWIYCLDTLIANARSGLLTDINVLKSNK